MNNPHPPPPPLVNYKSIYNKIKNFLKGVLSITLATPMHRIVFLLQTQHANPQFK